MDANKEHNPPEADNDIPPPSYESVVTQLETDAKMKAGSGEAGFTYPPGYSTIPLNQPYFQNSASPSGATNIPPLYYYPPQIPQATVAPPHTGYTVPPPHTSMSSSTGPVPTVNYVIVNQPASTTLVQNSVGERGHKPPNFMCLSLITCLCFNCMFGLLALAFSCHSDTAYAAGNTERAKQYGRYAFYVNITGILISAMFTVLMTIMV